MEIHQLHVLQLMKKCAKVKLKSNNYETRHNQKHHGPRAFEKIEQRDFPYVYDLIPEELKREFPIRAS